MPDPVPSSPNDTVFAVDTLLKYMGDDVNAHAIVAKIVRDACAPGMAPLRLAGQALAEQRLSDAGRIFHGLRGSIGTLGAKRLVAASMALEIALKEARVDELPTLFAAVEHEYAQVLDHAAAWLATLDTAGKATQS